MNSSTAASRQRWQKCHLTSNLILTELKNIVPKKMARVFLNLTCNMKYFYLLFIIFFAGCKLSTNLSSRRIDNNLRVQYDLFYNNRTAKHKPIAIYVSVDSLNAKKISHRLYMFYLNSDTVEKFHSFNKQRENYILVSDSTINDSGDKAYSITNFESEMFDKIIYFSDSLKLKDFRFLKKANGFKISTQKLGYYFKAK